jgi:hypothetical protein
LTEDEGTGAGFLSEKIPNCTSETRKTETVSKITVIACFLLQEIARN